MRISCDRQLLRQAVVAAREWECSLCASSQARKRRYNKLAELERVAGQLPPPVGLAEELRAAVLRRKGERERLEGVPLIDPRLFPPRSPDGDVLLSGTSGSPGVAQGPVRIVRNSSEFDKLIPGDVIVAPYTNPSWTPLFQRAVAVVVDSGSFGSHAAIVAREYGIPAVMATMTATRTLRDGEWILVNGSLGAVFPATPPAAQGADPESMDGG